MNDKVLIAGLGKSGISSAKLLLKLGGEVILYDENENIDRDVLMSFFTESEQSHIAIILGQLAKLDILGVAMCVISPGISLEAEFVDLLDQNNIQIWSEIQLAFHVAKGKLIAITGTNGKTTTTVLVGEIMKAHFKDVYVVGNVGKPYSDIALDTKDDSVTVLETSSFQLETIIDFKPHISAILNITPDHLNRHHSMENYIRIKEDICINQGKDDYCILNYDSDILREFGRSAHCKAKTVYFSASMVLDKGVYVRDGNIYINEGNKEQYVLNVDDLELLGKHNQENVCAAVAMAHSMDIPVETIANVCKAFEAVPHRIEFVADRYGVKYYNDSKGTNPDAAIQALKAMPGPTLLIAGGYDKGSDYNEWAACFIGRLRYLVLIGQTRDDIADCARQHGFTDIMYAESLDEAVKVCASYADCGDYVLLSPACASWGMFKDYEQRGDLFKEYVRSL